MDRFRTAERALWTKVGATPTERFLDLPSGLRVRIQEHGAGPPALLIHGVMTAGSSYAQLVANLPDARCIVLDRPGCGLSAPWELQPQFRGQAVQVILEVLDAMKLERAVVVGSSLGALWSTWFALAHPARVHKLVLLGPSIGFPGVHPPIFMRIVALPVIGALIRRKLKPSNASLRRIFAEMGHHKSLDAGVLPDELFEWGVALAETGTQRRELDVILRAVGVTGARRWIQLGDAALRELSVPTLLYAGTDDTHGGPALAERVAGLIPHATVQTLQDAGHLLWIDAPSTVAAAVQQFIADERVDKGTQTQSA